MQKEATKVELGLNKEDLYTHLYYKLAFNAQIIFDVPQQSVRLIKEQRLNNIIEKYILELYPVVKSVTFTTKDVYLASGDKSERRTIQRNIINVGFKGEASEI